MSEVSVMHDLSLWYRASCQAIKNFMSPFMFMEIVFLILSSSFLVGNGGLHVGRRLARRPANDWKMSVSYLGFRLALFSICFVLLFLFDFF